MTSMPSEKKKEQLNPSLKQEESPLKEEEEEEEEDSFILTSYCHTLVFMSSIHLIVGLPGLLIPLYGLHSISASSQ